ncbi:sensor histidine kinase [Catenuloplanes atrovinosus]|uniref:histidine kinase n=1 Tax=Catenuloplanes atrovinosus TaxID=137266 RepID=A0AAE3YPH9_9ACTN|nr:HAMP domain-containing sensor histidine kinase [Catenuloplanes atrovinosus]MDR7276832.1 signal transduction histidine kinase [Catenuloplanes atrovinosus]
MTGSLWRLAKRLVPGRARPGAVTAGEMLVLRTLCHELRPPVSTLGSLLRALDRETDPPARGADDSHALARLAAAHTRHLEELLRHAADIAEGLSRAPDDAATVPLGRLLPELAATVPDGRLDLRVGAAAARWPVHPRHTRQILMNLLANAVRHGPADGRITLLARTGARSLRLMVCDEGEVTAELTAALRRDAAPAGMHGLGLWLVRQLARRHGGSVHARPVVPSGVAVCVLLPRRPGLSRRGQRLAR